MDNFEQQIINKESLILNKKATRSYDDEAIKREEKDYPIFFRTPFQRDRDRIIHSKAFRRLMHKTQVFVKPDSEHIRTRLTHTLEVMQIARSIARAIGGNEDLTEAIALGHDLGHTPFGHIGEEALNGKLHSYELRNYDLFFEHNVQSWRIVKYLEKYEKFKEGLNLTQAVKFGILRHSGRFNNGDEMVKVFDKDGNRIEVHFKQTLEEKIVRIADDIAWLNHDWNDGIRSGILSNSLLGNTLITNLGISQADRINKMIKDVIETFNYTGEVKFSNNMEKLKEELKEKIKKYLWESDIIKRYNNEAKRIIKILFDFFSKHPEKLPEETKKTRNLDPTNLDPTNQKKLAIIIADYISGMTDDWCLKNYEAYIYSPYSRMKKLIFNEECEWLEISNENKENGDDLKIKEPEHLAIKKNTKFVIFDSKYLVDLGKISKNGKVDNEFIKNHKKGEAVYIGDGLVEIKKVEEEKVIKKGDILIIK